MSQAKNMAIYTIYQRTSGGSDIGEEIVTEIFLIQRIDLKRGKSVLFATIKFNFFLMKEQRAKYRKSLIHIFMALFFPF